ncbi:uncharacterized protein AB675_8836 [Cyphellophora attinorum]|uniref:Uncharacterized protein n=1 Tax=Cyphellophora attinorum TaxID=1664694 RepID=A0A0N1P3M8_9EURO|nr:uncharacterized protein AB675_8836 [Phialophora attinorum]KPI44215.1 hypothetical protein AB675_8836 [Phialophora attinorum]
MAAKSRPGALQTWLQPPTNAGPATGKRKWAADEATAEAAPAPKSAGSKSTTTSTTKSTSKSKDSAKEAKKLFNDKLKDVEKRHLDLDKKVKAMSPNSRAITVDNYAVSAAKHAGVVAKLLGMGSPVHAFNFAMALADSSHRNITTSKMSALLAAIEAREKPGSEAWLNEEALSKVPHRFTEKDADVGEYKTGQPNKQQRNQIQNQFIIWEKGRRAARRERREQCLDWVRCSLDDLVADRDYLKDYGVGEDFSRGRDEEERNSYFFLSIKRLEEMIAERSA